jgi:hypothetical protein
LYRFVLVGAAITGAFVGGVFSYVFLNGIVINGRSLLQRAGLPLTTPVLFALAGAVSAAISMIRSHRQEQSLRSELPEVARMLGLVYEEYPDLFPGLHPTKLFRQKWGFDRNRPSGTSDGVPAHMFDLTTIAPGNRSGGPWTAVLFQQTHLPAFTCVPNFRAIAWVIPSVSFEPEVGDQMAHQAVADFEKAYHLSLPEKAVRSDEDEVRRLFRPPRLEALARCPGWHIESSGSCLVFARDGTARAADRPALWREAIELRRALLAPVSSALVPIPAAQGMEHDRLSQHRSGRSWGGIAGAAVGCFGSFIAFGALWLSRRPGPGPDPLFFAFIPVVLGGLAIGAFAGTRLGGRLAERSYQPTPDGAPAPQVGEGWVFAGAFAGWGLGSVIGMGLSMAVGRLVPVPWLMPIVIFSPALLCLILGGVAGYRVARRRADRRKGA